MAEFMNIENDGNWYRGNTYTFEAKFDNRSEHAGPYECWSSYVNACVENLGNFYIETDQFVTDEFTEGPCILDSGGYTQNGNIFLEDGSPIEGISVLSYEHIESGPDYFIRRYTVEITEDCPLGDITIESFLFTAAGYVW